MIRIGGIIPKWPDTSGWWMLILQQSNAMNDVCSTPISNHHNQLIIKLWYSRNSKFQIVFQIMIHQIQLAWTKLSWEEVAPFAWLEVRVQSSEDLQYTHVYIDRYDNDMILYLYHIIHIICITLARKSKVAGLRNLGPLVLLVSSTLSTGAQSMEKFQPSDISEGFEPPLVVLAS